MSSKVEEQIRAAVAAFRFLGFKPTAKSQQPRAHKKTHRMLAWGVLGSASDGLPFLLTHPVVFRSM
jgi:hypothetical protein